MTGEIGNRARTLGPGLHFLIPFLYATNKQLFTTIAENEVGMLESIDGDPVPAGKIFARVVEGHDAFQDGESFLKNGGEKGPQIELLPPGMYRINLDLFDLRKMPVVMIEKGQIGLVTSMDGDPIPAGRLLAKKVEGHSNFENGLAFLQNGGQRGPQFDVLKPGTHYVNPLIFKVELDDVAVVERGQVAVVVANVGEEPHQVKQLVEERAKGEGEGAKILAMREATAKAYELQNKAVGQQGVTAIEIAKQIAAGNIKVTPDFLVQGGDNLGGLVSAFLTDILVGKRQAREVEP